MKRILLTGMSGVGKSTVISRLRAEGYRAIDLDDPAWSQWQDSADGQGPSPLHSGKDWVWRADRVSSLLATQDATQDGTHGDTHDAEVLFVSGCASNQGRFHDRFDEIVLLSAPAAVMVDRLANRDNNRYGKHPAEVARAVEFKETIEPKLRSVASLEVDTSAPLDDVVTAVLDLLRT